MLATLHSILSRAPAPLPFDDHIFHALLLALLGNESHVLLNTPDDDVLRVLKLTVNILHSYLALSVVKLKLRPSDALTPTEFLRLLFLHTTSPTQRNVPHQSSSRKSYNGSLSVTPGPPSFKRSSSYPSEITAAVTEHFNDNDTIATSPSTLQPGLTAGGNWDKTSSLRSQKRRDRVGLADTMNPPSLINTHDEESPLYEGRTLPQALVISGLEYTSLPVQRALLKVLSERQVVLDGRDENDKGLWNLPPGFFVVCVCPTGDGHERPPLHKNLIDRFAMSATIFLQADNASDSRISYASSKDPDVGTSRVILSASELAALQMFTSPAHTRIRNSLTLYLADLLTAARHHPHLDGSLLSARAHADCLTVARALRVLHGTPANFSSMPLEAGGCENREDDAAVFDVSDEDVRTAFQRVVTHRLRVRDGPGDEVLASAIFGLGTISGDGREWSVGRRTVKEILKEILDMV